MQKRQTWHLESNLIHYMNNDTFTDEINLMGKWAAREMTFKPTFHLFKVITMICLQS